MYTERLYPLSEICTYLPVDKCYKTVYGWTQKGVLGISGQRVKLEWKVSSGVRHTSVEAYYRFIDRQNGVGTYKEDVADG